MRQRDTWTLMFIVAPLARRFAFLEKGDDPALLHAEIMHADAGSARELLPQQRTERFDPCFAPRAQGRIRTVSIE